MSDSYDDYEAKIQLAEYAWEIKDARHTFRKNRIKENKMSREAMQMALGALESDPISHAGLVSRKQAIAALRQALETEQEPVATVTSESGNPNLSMSWWHEPALPVGTKIYTSPPKATEWVGLTADEIWECNRAKSGSAVEFHICYAHQNLEDFAESIEAKLKEKNGG